MAGPASATLILEGLIFLTDQLWKINEKLERIGVQNTEETRKQNVELTELRHKLVASVTEPPGVDNANS